MAQPVIRGIQAVGAVDILYRYNSSDNKLEEAAGFKELDTSTGLKIAGFRLDGEFLRANPQIASSVVIPILGGGGVALTNNNRTGTLNLTCTRVSTPDTSKEYQMLSGSGIGPVGSDDVYDLVTLAQQQQAQTGGDAAGASIVISFMFCNKRTNIQFDGCTVATVDPIALAGNDAATYNVVYNYLAWGVSYTRGSASIGTVTQAGGIE